MDVREKLVEIVCDPAQINGCIHRCNHPPCAMVSDIVDALIAHGVTVQEWIPVDDRLPEPKHEFDARNWYLVALSNGVVKELAYEFHNHSVFGYGWRETAYPVTYWMPLPEPPKGE